ncbi:hypothetical protein CAPTEDRAFT_225700 [Capitella teleta]|uniref:Tudor domain-containing protein 3 n=1 Tax=Capitella teleta TaxID=283909 RepID=R7URX3_CAPTE|nr:hypothetical protein CAPTEDRAFT_225700 [Capitella teleta]|eukprot:ELU08898.1 hypothetical protein CAPTEDRAFT_225700 [Capitella teleta]
MNYFPFTKVKPAKLDLREIGEKHLPDGRSKQDSVDGPFVLQITKIRNVSAPKDNEESQGAPKLLRLMLTDGHLTCSALQMDNIPELSHNCPPGTKLKLSGRVKMNHSFLLLDRNNCKILGGHVDRLFEPWNVKKQLAQHHRSAHQKEGGPPIFTPFGQRRKDPPPLNHKKDNFKSLATQEQKKETTEFEQQRKATIAKLQETKSEVKPKIFGSAGVNKVQHDRDLAKIVEMGFSTDQASIALRKSNGNVEQALENLLNQPFENAANARWAGSSGGYSRGEGRGPPERGGRGPPERDDRGRGPPERGDGRRGPPERGGKGPSEREDRGRGPPNRDDNRRGPPDRGRGRRGHFSNDPDPEDEHSRPSGPAMLSDFLTGKIPSKAAPAKPPQRAPSPLRHQTDDPQKRTPPNLPPRLMKQRDHKPPAPLLPTPSQRSDNSRNSNNRFSDNRNDHRPARGQPRRDDQRNGGDASQEVTQQMRDMRLGGGGGGGGGGGRRSGGGNAVFMDTYPPSGFMCAPPANINTNRVPTMQFSAQRQQPAPKQQNNNQWKIGDYCMAKYYSDQQFYNAFITAFDPSGQVATVTFQDYGNTESVFISDLRPLKPNWDQGQPTAYVIQYAQEYPPAYQDGYVPTATASMATNEDGGYL